MSWFKFIASDTELDEYSEDFIIKGDMLVIENEDKTLNIYKEEYEGYPEEYTKLPYIMGVEIGEYECISEKLLKYIQEAADKCSVLEIWSIWLDDPDKNIQHLKRKVEELSEKDVAWIFNKKSFEHPQCLEIYRGI